MAIEYLNYIKSIIQASLNMLNTASPWIVLAFFAAALIYGVFPLEKLPKHLGNTSIGALFKSIFSGLFLPICSCSTIPIGMSMYYSGAYLGPVLAFATAAPIINPIAIILSFGLLGRDITLIYILAGIIVPLIVGILGNAFGGDELFFENPNELNIVPYRMEYSSILEKIKDGLLWVGSSFGLLVSKYTLAGIIIGGFILVTIPGHIIDRFLSDSNILSLAIIAIVSALMYVCATGHIPLVGTLLASGASPGAAITFLIAGCSTNVPELYGLFKMIGKRAAVIYSVAVTIMAVIFGYITNLFLMPGYIPEINISKIDYSIETANKLLLVMPNWLSYISSFIIIVLGVYAFYVDIRSSISRRSRKNEIV